ncbi:hypothetical protein [Neobacillus mesonae]|nr:hypothetical protein [Neobacillus mesonae]
MMKKVLRVVLGLALIGGIVLGTATTDNQSADPGTGGGTGGRLVG